MKTIQYCTKLAQSQCTVLAQCRCKILSINICERVFSQFKRAYTDNGTTMCQSTVDQRSMWRERLHLYTSTRESRFPGWDVYFQISRGKVETSDGENPRLPPLSNTTLSTNVLWIRNCRQELLPGSRWTDAFCILHDTGMWKQAYEAACTLTRWQHFRVWNDVMATMLKILLHQSM